jgi:phosphate transport system substrate-binding protein
MHKMSKLLAVGLLALSVALTGCGGKKETPAPAAGAKITGTVTASGSTALLPLAQRAKELFEEAHEGVTVNVSGGGSFTGLNQVASGAVNIGNSDVQPPADQAKDLVEFKVAVSPFVMITHKDLPVASLTMDQYAKILKGEITNWKDVGGPDQKITVVSRQQSSGSRATIVKVVLNNQGDITKDALVQDSNGKVLETVASTPGAIGYVDAAYAKPDKVKILQVAGVTYSPEAVAGGQWPIWAYGYMYTKGQPTGAVKAFLDYITSAEFQEKELPGLGFVPVTKMKK